MRISFTATQLVVLLLTAASYSGVVQAFAPQQGAVQPSAALPRTTTTRRFGMVDPSSFHDLPHHLGNLHDAMTSLTLSDLDASGLPFIGGAGDAASDVAATADAAADAAAAGSSNGWFGFLTGPIEGLLVIIHNALEAVGVSANAWGVAIIAMTVIIKLVTFPLTKTQLESTNKMQMMQPAIKELQKKYESNPEVMNQKVAEFYQANDINPLAGCLPSFVQIPIFIGLYRAVLTLAKEDKLDEPFLWLPNLEGPTYGADPTHGSDWILKGWTDAGPSLGWDTTISFLILPVLLVISQFISMQIMQPKSDDPAQQQSNVILKFLPLMIGWFSLSVPAALTVYWFANNLITTASSVLIRNSMPKPEPVSVSSSSASVAEPQSTIFAPPREKPSGFASSTPSFSPDEVKPITAMDAEIVPDAVDDDDAGSMDDDDSGTGMETQPKPKKKTRGKKKRKKKKN